MFMGVYSTTPTKILLYLSNVNGMLNIVDLYPVYVLHPKNLEIKEIQHGVLLQALMGIKMGDEFQSLGVVGTEVLFRTPVSSYMPAGNCFPLEPLELLTQRL